MMIAKGLTVSKPSIIKLLEEATESHVSPFLNNVYMHCMIMSVIQISC